MTTPMTEPKPNAEFDLRDVRPAPSMALLPDGWQDYYPTVSLWSGTQPDSLIHPNTIGEVMDRMLISARWLKKASAVQRAKSQQDQLGKSAAQLRPFILEYGTRTFYQMSQELVFDYVRGALCTIQTVSDTPIEHRLTAYKGLIRFARDVGAISDGHLHFLAGATKANQPIGRRSGKGLEIAAYPSGIWAERAGVQNNNFDPDLAADMAADRPQVVGSLASQRDQGRSIASAPSVDWDGAITVLNDGVSILELQIKRVRAQVEYLQLHKYLKHRPPTI